MFHFGQKPRTTVHSFNHISLSASNSSQEGATELQYTVLMLCISTVAKVGGGGVVSVSASC